MKRGMCAVYMDKKIYDVFRKYASRKSHRRSYQVWSTALTDYMEANPIECMVVEIQRDLSNKIENGIQRELEEKLLCRNIEDCLETLNDIELTRRGNFSMVLSDLIKHVSDATRFREPSDKLLTVLHKVKESGRLE